MEITQRIKYIDEIDAREFSPHEESKSPLPNLDSIDVHFEPVVPVSKNEKEEKDKKAKLIEEGSDR